MKELDGDILQTTQLKQAFNEVSNDNIPVNDIINKIPICLGGKDINTLSDRCNTIIELEIKKCYGTFTSWTDSILNKKSLNEMQNITNTIALCEKLIFKGMIGYDIKQN